MPGNQRKTVLITGASRGIGRALAHEYARHGSPVVLLARDTERLRDLARDITAAGGSAHYQRCDVSDPEQVRAGVAYARRMLGSIDLAILNAGVGIPEWIDELRCGTLRETFEVNTLAIGHFLEALVPLMKKQGGGTIAGMSSLADARGMPGSGAYNASKAAATILLESARVELRRQNIRVVTVRPGFVRTEMSAKNAFDMPFLLEPEDAARIIRRRIARGWRVIQFPLPLVLAMRLLHVLPVRLFDFLLSRAVRPE